MINSKSILKNKNKLTNILARLLLLTLLCLPNSACSEPLIKETHAAEKITEKNHVFIIYSPDSTLQSSIIQKLSDNLRLKRPDLVISKTSPENIISTVNNSTDIIIGIGSEGMKNANEHYPKTSKLFISTDPEKFSLDKNHNKNDAILYMTQSYCRQIQFIKLINDDWKVISLLNSQKKPMASKNIKKCAKKFGIKTYTVNTSAEDNMTANVKKALDNSDLLLALPDKSIYNSNTVKNILLTSYRHRKPVIAFSRNFVNAGALASLHSSIEQVAQNASNLINQYYELNQRFDKSIHYPQSFDVSINRQVFRALDLPPPDIGNLKRTLEQHEPDDPGTLR